MPGGPPLRLGLLPLLLVAGCSTSTPTPADGPVDVPAPSVAPDAQAACARLLASLPAEVDPGVDRREVIGDPTSTAAWGDPPVTLRCGVEAPDRPEAPVSINGVDWSVRNTSTGARWTTRDRSVNVEVDVPDAYANGAEIVNPLSGPVAAAIPAR